MRKLSPEFVSRGVVALLPSIQEQLSDPKWVFAKEFAARSNATRDSGAMIIKGIDASFLEERPGEANRIYEYTVMDSVDSSTEMLLEDEENGAFAARLDIKDDQDGKTIATMVSYIENIYDDRILDKKASRVLVSSGFRLGRLFSEVGIRCDTLEAMDEKSE